MNTNVISVINFKGGVGKSTVTLNLSYELSKKGFNVLMIDFDGQGNLTRFSGIDKDKVDGNIITMLDEVMKRNYDVKHPIYSINDRLDIITCNIAKDIWEARALSEISRESILKRYLQLIKKNFSYDFIFIDNAPAVNLGFQNSLVASDYYLMVTEPEIASTDGLSTVFDIICQIKEINKKLEPAGIVINKQEKRTNLHNIMENVIRSAWMNKKDMYVFNTYIPKSIVAGESEFLHKPISMHASASKIAGAYISLADEFLSKIGENAKWWVK